MELDPRKHRAEAERIERDIEAFIAKGGKIERLPDYGAVRIDQGMTVRERQVAHYHEHMTVIPLCRR